jgi:hypothetical protein
MLVIEISCYASDYRDLAKQIRVFGDVVADRRCRLSGELFDVIGGSVVTAGAV